MYFFTLPEDNRNVIYGVIKDCYKEPICNAVVKLIEVDCKCGKEERKPVAHTFTNEDGEFVFGPLCPNKSYEVNVWVNKVKHVKICAKCKHEAECLKGVDIDCCDFTIESSNDCCNKCNKKSEYKNECKCDYKPECKTEHKDDCKYDNKPECKTEHKDDCKHDCKPECKTQHKDECKKECYQEYRPNYKNFCR